MNTTDNHVELNHAKIQKNIQNNLEKKRLRLIDLIKQSIVHTHNQKDIEDLQTFTKVELEEI